MTETVEWLSGPAGQDLIEALSGHDAISARRAFPDVPPERLSAALQQAELRRRGARTLLATEDGMQQATPPAVATARAARLRDSGIEHIIDAGCGLGTDAAAFCAAGLAVTAYEVDPVTAAMAAANLAGSGATVITGDVTTADLPEGAALFADPARRQGHRTGDGRPIRVGDPGSWRPPWPWVLQQAAHRPVVARAGPSLRDLPPGEFHCTSLEGALVDATVWFADLARTPRRATVLAGDRRLEMAGHPPPAEVDGAGPLLLDPDPAIVRAGLVTAAASRASGWLLDEHLAYVSCREPAEPLLGTWYEVLDVLPARAAEIRAACRARGIDSLTVIARGVGDHSRLTRRIGLPEGPGATLVLARVGSPGRRTVAHLCRRLRTA